MHPGRLNISPVMKFNRSRAPFLLPEETVTLKIEMTRGIPPLLLKKILYRITGPVLKFRKEHAKKRTATQGNSKWLFFKDYLLLKWRS
jgi:hypothetical protein